jgi:hypothetical protein
MKNRSNEFWTRDWVEKKNDIIFNKKNMNYEVHRVKGEGGRYSQSGNDE